MGLHLRCAYVWWCARFRCGRCCWGESVLCEFVFEVCDACGEAVDVAVAVLACAEVEECDFGCDACVGGVFGFLCGFIESFDDAGDVVGAEVGCLSFEYCCVGGGADGCVGDGG